MSSIDAEALYRAVLDQVRAAYGDAFGAADGPVLAGIYSGGAWLAERLWNVGRSVDSATLFACVGTATAGQTTVFPPPNYRSCDEYVSE